MKKLKLIIVLCFLLIFSSFQSFTFGYSENPQELKNNEIFLLVNSTKLIIYNPYDQVDFQLTNHYKTNLHTHTTRSDGSSSPDAVIYHYHDVGNYDILALTDHNKNTWSWSNWISEDPIEYSDSSEYYPDIDMLAISGNELSYGHHRGSLLNNLPYSGFFMRFAFWYIQKQNGLAVFHHPGRYINEVSWYHNFFDIYDNVIVGIEVYNQGDRYKNDRLLWDQINKERDPDDLIWGFSNDDMHHISSHAFRNYQHLLMNDLTENEFKNALVNGAFYFSYEPNGSKSTKLNYGIAMTPKLIDVIIDENRIDLIGENFDNIEWYDEDSQIITSNEFIDISSMDTNFVRAVLINEYGRTYTQPFGIEILR